MLGKQDSVLGACRFGRLDPLISIELSRIKDGRWRYIIELVSHGMEYLNIAVDQHTDFAICPFDLLFRWDCKFCHCFDFPIQNDESFVCFEIPNFELTKASSISF